MDALPAPLAQTLRSRPTPAGQPLERLHIRRNTFLLSASMAMVNGVAQLSVAVATLTVTEVSGLDALAGVGPAIFLVASALVAPAAGRAMDRHGRVPVLAGGYAIGFLGSVLAGLATLAGSITLVLIAFALAGTTLGTTKLGRVAAADMYPPDRRARGISLVLFGAVVGAGLGPLVFTPLFSGRAPGASTLALGWFAAAACTLIGLALVLLVRPDPRRIAEILRERGLMPEERDTSPPLPTAQLLRLPGARASFTAAAASTAVMAAVMNLTGLVVVHEGHAQADSFPVISAHIVGMYGLVLFVGAIVDRIGRTTAQVAGLLLVAVACALLPFSSSVLALAHALFLLGLGWNFAFVAATARLSDLTRPVERGQMLGLNDLVGGLAGGGLAVAEGVLYHVGGATAVALTTVPLVLVPALVAIRAGGRIEARTAAEPLLPGALE